MSSFVAQGVAVAQVTALVLGQSLAQERPHANNSANK